MTTIGIIVFDEVLTCEVIGPAEVFGIAREHDWFTDSRVLLIGLENTPTIRTAEGLRLGVDCTLETAPTLDVLIVPGANEVGHLQSHAALNAFIQRQQGWVASLCAGAFILGAAGVLDGKQATTWFGGEASLQADYPQIQVVHNRPVVVDDRRLTANGGLVSYRAALTLLAQLTSPDHAQQVYRTLGIARLGTWADIVADVVTA